MKYAFYLVFLFTALLVACSSSEPAAAPETTTESGDEPTLREAIEDAGVELDPVMREFMMLYEKRSDSEFTVAYTTTMSFDGETMTTSMTEFHESDERTRTDVSIPEMGETRNYVDGDTYTSCSKFTGEWRCQQTTAGDYETGTEEGGDYTVETTWDEEEVQEAKFEKDGTMQIAGVTAQCFKSDIGGLVGRQCLSAEGVTLYMTATDAEGGVMELRATSYKKSVAASDFALPAEPTDPNSPEAQEASCRDACVMMEMSDAECDDFCSNMAQYE